MEETWLGSSAMGAKHGNTCRLTLAAAAAGPIIYPHLDAAFRRQVVKPELVLLSFLRSNSTMHEIRDRIGYLLYCDRCAAIMVFLVSSHFSLAPHEGIR